MYEIIGTEIEEGMRLVRIMNQEGMEMIYYEDEIKNIPCPDLNFFLVWNMWRIREGVFDTKMIDAP